MWMPEILKIHRKTIQSQQKKWSKSRKMRWTTADLLYLQKIKHSGEKIKWISAPDVVFYYFQVLPKQKPTLRGVSLSGLFSSHPCSRPNCLKEILAVEPSQSTETALPRPKLLRYLTCNLRQIPDMTWQLSCQKTLKIFTKVGSILGEAKNVAYAQGWEIQKSMKM